MYQHIKIIDTGIEIHCLLGAKLQNNPGLGKYTYSALKIA
jgi:hypothetical protein